MASVRAPRSRTMSTERLVSVVVPDWLMATTSASAIDPSSAVSLIVKPLNSEALSAWTCTPGVFR